MFSSFLSTFVDSPVSELSFTCNEKLSIILPSATIISPASSNKISPGTTFFESISCVRPFLITFGCGDDNAFKDSNDFSAFKYCTVPKIALRMITAKITIVLSTFPEIIEITAATINIITSKSLNCSKKI